MHEIPPALETLLREQGMDDARLEELRRTGTLKDATSGTTIRLDEVSATGGPLDPAVIERLRRFRALIPEAAMDQIEVATGQDIDGDGRIGASSADRASHSDASSSERASHSDASSSANISSSDASSSARWVPTDAQRADSEERRLGRNASGRHGDSSALPTGSGPFVEQTPAAKLGSKLILFLVVDTIIFAALVYWFAIR